MINFSPWYYRELLGENLLIESPDFYQISTIEGDSLYESNVKLKDHWRPTWLNQSTLYKDCDGSGTDKFKNIAIYKAISEAIERLAFYELIDTQEVKFSFDKNPTTTGLAAFPYFNYSPARINARLEAIERWAIHEFNKNNLPLKIHKSLTTNLNFYEILTPFQNVRITLLSYERNGSYYYGFAGGTNLNHSFNKSIIELDRNIRVLDKVVDKMNYSSFDIGVDRTLAFFSTLEGNQKFKDLINLAPRIIKSKNPQVLCDKPLVGHWEKYSKVWRYLLEDSYFNCREDHTFFMF